ncbi:MAG: GNAT family N-acetyltransferase [Chloroflexota bacterium]
MQSTAGKKSTFAYSIRPLVESDIPAFIDHTNECARLEEAVEAVTLEEWVEWYNSPMNADHQTLALLTNGDGSEGPIVGTMSIEVRPEDTNAWSWLHVHPDYRDNGVGSALYDEAVRLTHELGANTLHMTPSSHAKLLIDFLTRRGHQLERWFWDMQLPAGHEIASAELPAGFTMRTFVHNQDEQLLTDVRNVTFADHYGSVQRTLEQITHITTLPDFHADGVFFAFEGDKVAGFCYTSHDPREWERRGEKIGHVQLLGVVPEYRGKGLGRVLLLTGSNYLRQYVSVVELGVEGKNNNALALYESVGFRQHKAWANMPKEL